MITLCMRWLILLMFLVLVLSTRAVERAVGQEGSAPDPRFGMTEAFWEPEEAAELKVGWDRILFYWREIQPTGPDDWNTLHVREEWLAEANAQGRTVVGLIKNTAPWASDDGTEAGLPRGLYLPIDDEGNLWARFVRRLANYYSQHNVHHWIIWNEPEIESGVYGYEFAGGARDYYQLLKVAYQVMKEEDPAAIIHLAGLTWWHDQSYLRRVLEIAATDTEAPPSNYFFDVISLHIYFRPETIPVILNAVEAIQRDFGVDKPVWINETNAPPNQDPSWPVSRPDFPVDLDQQAWYLIQAYALGFAEGAEVIGVYKLIDIHLSPGAESFGLLRPDFSRRPSFEAYKTTTRYLDRFHRTFKQADPKYYVVSFARPSGISRVMWARTQEPVFLRLPAVGGSGRLVGPTGAEVSLLAENDAYAIKLDGARCAGECFIGGPPLILVEQAPVPAGGPAPASVFDPETGPIPATVSLDATPTATPTQTPTPTPTATATATSSPTATRTATPEFVEGSASSVVSLSIPAETPAPDDSTGARQAVGSPSHAAGPASQATWKAIGLVVIGGAVFLGGAILALLVGRRREGGGDD
jgi:hypothetical protein